MLLPGVGQLAEIAAIRPKRKTPGLLFVRERLQIRVALEETMKGVHKTGARSALKIDEYQIVMDQADLFEASMHSWTALRGERQHMSVHFFLSGTTPPQGFLPCCDGQGRFPHQPDNAFFIGNLVSVWLEKARPPEIVQHIRHRPFRP